MLGLYLHIPFCRRKCPYCDFYSVADHESLLRGYPELLGRHLDWASAHGWPGPVGTVYFGGGTPSLLPPAAVGALLERIAGRFGLSGDAEITLEANPGTVTAARLAGYRAAGVNRLSLGLQSLDPGQLAVLGRLHSREQGVRAVRWARRAGFANLSLDLIFALPGQTLAALAEEVRRYLDLAPEHLSCYGLTAEPDTSFHHRVACGELRLPDEDDYADAFLLLHEQLGGGGYEHYEIASYARPGYRCRHNLGYWQRRPYLGIGAGAHSFRATEWGERWAVPADLEGYRSALHEFREPAELVERFSRRGAMSETLYLALRTRTGVDAAAFAERFGRPLTDVFPHQLRRLQPWLRREAGGWQLTVDGWLLYDGLVRDFL